MPDEQANTFVFKQRLYRLNRLLAAHHSQKQIDGSKGSMNYGAQPKGLMLSDTNRVDDLLVRIPMLRNSIALIFREDNSPEREKLLKQVISISRRARVKVIIAGDVQLALRCRADGIHFREWQIRQRRSKIYSAISSRWMITASAHSLCALRRAESLGVNSVLLSPVFPTGSKKSNNQSKKNLGLFNFNRMVRKARSGVYALGGVNHSNFKRISLMCNRNLAGAAFISLL